MTKKQIRLQLEVHLNLVEINTTILEFLNTVTQMNPGELKVSKLVFWFSMFK